VTFNASLSTTNWNSTIQEEIPIVSYEWNFGDGTTGRGLIANHAYNQEGTYNVTLTITDEGGSNDTATIPLTVEESSTGSGFPWWIIVVVVAAAGIGVALPVYFIKVRKPT
jgi:PKD repeat protein